MPLRIVLVTGSRIATGCAGGNIKILDVVDGVTIQSELCVGHSAPVLSVVLDAPGKFLASSGTFADLFDIFWPDNFVFLFIQPVMAH